MLMPSRALDPRKPAPIKLCILKLVLCSDEAGLALLVVRLTIDRAIWSGVFDQKCVYHLSIQLRHGQVKTDTFMESGGVN